MEKTIYSGKEQGIYFFSEFRKFMDRNSNFYSRDLTDCDDIHYEWRTKTSMPKEQSRRTTPQLVITYRQNGARKPVNVTAAGVPDLVRRIEQFIRAEERRKIEERQNCKEDKADGPSYGRHGHVLPKSEI